MRPEMKCISEMKFRFAMKKILFTLVFIAGEIKSNEILFWSFDRLFLFLRNICIRRCFLSDDFIWCSVYIISHYLSPEMEFYFCQNDRNGITPAISLISGYLM